MSDASEELSDRIRAYLGHRPGLTERRMFGGRCFMLNGNMIAGAMKPGTLLLRVGAERYAEALLRPGTGPMLMGDREMTGFVEVADDVIADDEALAEALEYGLSFVKKLPPKTQKPAPVRRVTARRR